MTHTLEHVHVNTLLCVQFPCTTVVSIFSTVVTVITDTTWSHQLRTVILLGFHHRELKATPKQAHLYMLLLLLPLLLLLLQLQILSLCPVFLAHKQSLSAWMCK